MSSEQTRRWADLLYAGALAHGCSAVYARETADALLSELDRLDRLDVILHEPIPLTEGEADNGDA